MSAQDREFSMQEGFVSTTAPLTVTVAGASNAVQAIQLGGGTLSVGNKVICFSIPSGKRSQLAVLKVN